MEHFKDTHGADRTAETTRRVPDSFNPDKRISVDDNKSSVNEERGKLINNDTVREGEVKSGDTRAETKPDNTESYNPDKRIGVDDNGKIYRYKNEVIPNATIEKNGYKYKTDELGRTVSAEGRVTVKDTASETRETIKAELKDIGRGHEQEGDERGHLIADSMNGTADIINVVPMSKELNKGEYSKLEGSLRTAASEGKEVYLKVEPQYKGDSRRPESFVVSYSINGEQFEKVFKNRSEQ